jgi:DNA mismatch repair protein MutS2
MIGKERGTAREARRSLRPSALGAARRALAPASFLADAQRYTPTAHAALAALTDLPDLLHVEAALGVDGPLLAGALSFAFAGAGCKEALDRAMDGVAPEASDWEPGSFAEDIALAELVESCLAVELGGWKVPVDRAYLRRVLARPPADPAVRAHRREVLAELLGSAELRFAFEGLYRTLHVLRALFDLPDRTSRYEETRRRLEILTTLRDLLDAADAGFADATSGLRRLHRFAAAARASEGYRHLVEILAHDAELARVDVRVQLGADGRVRRFSLLALEEHRENGFYRTPWRRFWDKLGLLLRGYRFSSDELVERWIDDVFDGVVHLLPPLVELQYQMELYLGMLALRDRCAARGLAVCFPELTDGGGRRVRGLFNPLLLAAGITPVPCDLESDQHDTVTLVTGANSGGKTRLLQALGLAQVLAQGGLLVPAAEARLRPASGLFASLVGTGAPRAEVGEGRLGAELIRIRQMFETARPGALVLLDEFCSGTNPSEGEEIFFLVLSLLGELGTEAFISTHFLEFTRRLSTEGRIANLAFLQVQLDAHQRPTYAVASGVAATSLAAQTAARLGVTREELLELIRRHRRRDGGPRE